MQPPVSATKYVTLRLEPERDIVNVGAEGRVYGDTFDATEAADSPIALDACRVTV